MIKPEVTSLLEAHELGLISHVCTSSNYYGNTKSKEINSIKSWMIYTEIIFHASCKSTWLPSGERIIINKSRKDKSVAMADNLHGMDEVSLNEGKILDQINDLKKNADYKT